MSEKNGRQGRADGPYLLLFEFLPRKTYTRPHFYHQPQYLVLLVRSLRVKNYSNNNDDDEFIRASVLSAVSLKYKHASILLNAPKEEYTKTPSSTRPG